MHIEFESETLSNFLSYGKTPTEIQLNKVPMTLLLGESGAGKSSVANALSFCLFDDTLRGIKKGQLVNWENKKEGCVQVKFRIGSDRYTVKRTIKPNELHITKNDTVLNRDSAIADLQKHLEKNILKMDRRTFHQMVSLAEVNFTPFMQLEAADRRAFLEKIMGVEVFSTMNSIVKSKMKENEALISSLETSIDSAKQKIDIHETYIQRKKTESKQRLKDLKDEIAALQDKKEGLESECEHIKTVELPPIIENLPKKKATQEKLAIATEQLGKVKAKIDHYREKVALLEQHDVCPTCEREFSKEHVEVEKRKLKAKIAKLIEVRDKGIEVREKLQRRIETIEQKHEQIRKIKGRLENKEFSITQYTNNITKLERQLERLKESKNESVQEIMEDIAKLNEAVATQTAELAEALKRKEVFSTSIQLLRDDGIKAQIFKTYLPRINAYTNKFLEAMNLNLSFHLNEHFEEEIRSRGKEGASYRSFSAGQRQRIDAALLFTWIMIAQERNSVSTNLLFLDEVLDSHLNVELTESVLEVFNTPLFKNKNVFIVSHKKDISAKFTRVLNFELRDGFTRVS